MFTITVTGYVMAHPRIDDGEKGKNVYFTLKCKVGITDVLVTSRFYGRRMTPILEYVNATDQITVSGRVTAILQKSRKNREHMKYIQIYLAGYDYSLPPKPVDTFKEVPTTLPLPMIDKNSFAQKSDLEDKKVVF